MSGASAAVPINGCGREDAVPCAALQGAIRAGEAAPRPAITALPRAKAQFVTTSAYRGARAKRRPPSPGRAAPALPGAGREKAAACCVSSELWIGMIQVVQKCYRPAPRVMALTCFPPLPVFFFLNF